MSRQGPAGERPQLVLHLAVWVSLLILLALTTASSFVPLRGWNSPLNLLIAGIKAALVAWVFMHLRTSAPLIRLVAAAAIMWIAILLGLSLADILTRSGFISG